MNELFRIIISTCFHIISFNLSHYVLNVYGNIIIYNITSRKTRLMSGAYTRHFYISYIFTDCIWLDL